MSHIFAGSCSKKSLIILNKGKAWIKYKIINIKLIHKLLRDEWGEEANKEEKTVTETNYNYELPPTHSRAPGNPDQHRYKNKFNNFEQRHYDFEELEKMLLLHDVPIS